MNKTPSIIIIIGFAFVITQFLKFPVIANTTNMIFKTAGIGPGLLMRTSFSRDQYELQSQINEMIAGENYCLTAADCKVENFGCPFGDARPVNLRANLSRIQEGIEKYHIRANACEYERESLTYKPDFLCQAFKCKVF